jgi:hypothetical protein
VHSSEANVLQKETKQIMGRRGGLHKQVTSNIASILNFHSLSLTQILDNISNQTCEGCYNLSTLMDEV